MCFAMSLQVVSIRSSRDGEQIGSRIDRCSAPSNVTILD